MANHVKNQHFVPRFLLNYFADTECKIWCYDKQFKRSEKKGIGGVAFEQYFYDKTPGEREGSHEYIYQSAETVTAPIIKKIVEQKNINCITTNEKEILANFIVLQLNRTKSALKNTEYFLGQFLEPLTEFAKAHGSRMESEPELTRNFWLSTIENTVDFSKIILKKAWYLGLSNSEFLTSDNPVVRSNHKNRAISQVRGVLGLNSDGIEIYLPLTPSLILGILCEKSYMHQNGQVHQYLPENVEYVNHLQIKQSDRFVFAEKDNFELGEELL